MTPFSIVTNNINYLGVTLTKQVKDQNNKKFKLRWKQSKISEDGAISHAHELKELIEQKWPSCQKQSTDSMQFPPNFNSILLRARKSNSHINLE